MEPLASAKISADKIKNIETSSTAAIENLGIDLIFPPLLV
jgi:hypothetical protein